MMECLTSMCKALSLSPNTVKEKDKRRGQILEVNEFRYLILQMRKQRPRKKKEIKTRGHNYLVVE